MSILKKIFSKKTKNNRGMSLLFVLGTIMALTIVATTAFTLSANTKIRVDRLIDDTSDASAKGRLTEAANLFAEKMATDNSSVKSHAAIIYYAYDVYTLEKSEAEGTYYRLFTVFNGKYFYIDIFFALGGDSGDSGLNDTLFSEEALIGDLYSIDNMASMYLSFTGYMPVRDYPDNMKSTIPSDVNTINESVDYADSSATLLVDSLDFLYCNRGGAGYLQSDGAFTSNASTAVKAFSTGAMAGTNYYTLDGILRSLPVYYRQYEFDDAKKVAIMLQLEAMLEEINLDQESAFGLIYHGSNPLDSTHYGIIENSSFDYDYTSEETRADGNVKRLDEHFIYYSFDYTVSGKHFQGTETETLSSMEFAEYLRQYDQLVEYYENYISVADFMHMIGDPNWTSKYDYSIYATKINQWTNVEERITYNKATRQAAKNSIMNNTWQVSNALSSNLSIVPDVLTNYLRNKFDFKIFGIGYTVSNIRPQSIQVNNVSFNSNTNSWEASVKYSVLYDMIGTITGKIRSSNNWYTTENSLTITLSNSMLYGIIKDNYPRPKLDPNATVVSKVRDFNLTKELVLSKYLYILGNFIDKYIDEDYVGRDGRTVKQSIPNGATITGYAGAFVNSDVICEGQGEYSGCVIKLANPTIYIYYENPDGSTGSVEFGVSGVPGANSGNDIYVMAFSTNPSISDGVTPKQISGNSIAPITTINYFERDYETYGTELASTTANSFGYYTANDNPLLTNVDENKYYKSEFTYNDKECTGYYSSSETINVENNATLYIDGDLVLTENATLNMEMGTTLFINGDLVVDYYMDQSANFETLKNYGVNINCDGANVIVNGNIEYRGIKVNSNGDVFDRFRDFSTEGYVQYDSVPECNGHESGHGSDFRSNLHGNFIVNGDVNFYSEYVERDFFFGIFDNWVPEFSNPNLGATFYVDGKLDLSGFWTPCLYDLCRPNFIFAKVVVQPEVALDSQIKYVESQWQGFFGQDVDVDEYCTKLGYLFMICEDAINFSEYNFASVNIFTPYSITTAGIETNREVQENITKYISKENMDLYTEEEIDTWGLPPILRQAMFNAFISGNLGQTTDNPLDDAGYKLVYDPELEENN